MRYFLTIFVGIFLGSTVALTFNGVAEIIASKFFPIFYRYWVMPYLYINSPLMRYASNATICIIVGFVFFILSREKKIKPGFPVELKNKESENG